MSRKEWAEQECRIACKRENPDFDFDKDGLDEDSFDYGCACYKSALKAYNSLMEDGHSGMSFSFTKRILLRLMEELPLTPIIDDDFLPEDANQYGETPEWLAKQGLESCIQCRRMSSLFRYKKTNGEVYYRDVNRSFFVEIESPSDTFTSNDSFLDEMFPITMPYMPEISKYEIYCQTFLTDKKNGDFDTRGVLYVITPEGKKVDVNLYQTERDGMWVRISREEYDELLEKRIDKLNEVIANKLIWTLISNSASDDVIEKREAAYETKSDEEKQKYFDDLSKMCLFFNKPENYKYNTFSIHQKLCKGELEGISDIPELVEIADYLKGILKSL